MLNSHFIGPGLEEKRRLKEGQFWPALEAILFIQPCPTYMCVGVWGGVLHLLDEAHDLFQPHQMPFHIAPLSTPHTLTTHCRRHQIA